MTEAQLPLRLEADVTVTVDGVEVHAVGDTYELTGLSNMWARYQVKGKSAIPVEARTLYRDLITGETTLKHPGLQFSLVARPEFKNALGLTKEQSELMKEGLERVGLELGEE